jgi:hypothetical protein
LGRLITFCLHFVIYINFVQINLLHTFCYSFYGSVIWDLEAEEISRLCSAWHAAVKRVWRLPFNTHRYIASALGSDHPLYDEICCRVLRFHFGCLKSSNPIVSFVCRHALTCARALSPHGRNIIVLCNRYNIPYSLIVNNNCSAEVFRKFNDFQFNVYSESELCRLSVLYELLMLKNNIYEFSPCHQMLDQNDIDFCINDLCTD